MYRLLLESQKARPEIIAPQKIQGSISFRLTKGQLDDYLRQITGFSLSSRVKSFFLDWDSFREGMNDFAFWQPPKFNVLLNDGLGTEGACKACGYPHISIYPIGAKAPLCYEAVKFAEAMKATND